MLRVMVCDGQALRWIFPFSELKFRDWRILDLGFILQACQRREHRYELLTYGLYGSQESCLSGFNFARCWTNWLLSKQIHTYGGSVFGMSGRPVVPGPPIKSLRIGLF
jgi:predicted alpha/beta hydrolase